MGWASTYYGSKHALAANDRAQAAEVAAAEEAAESNAAYKAFLVKTPCWAIRRSLHRSPVRVQRNGTAFWWNSRTNETVM